jgi:hypothetical protein
LYSERKIDRRRCVENVRPKISEIGGSVLGGDAVVGYRMSCSALYLLFGKQARQLNRHARPIDRAVTLSAHGRTGSSITNSATACGQAALSRVNAARLPQEGSFANPDDTVHPWAPSVRPLVNREAALGICP